MHNVCYQAAPVVATRSWLVAASHAVPEYPESEMARATAIASIFKTMLLN